MDWREKLDSLRRIVRYGWTVVVRGPHTPGAEFRKLYGDDFHPDNEPRANAWLLFEEMEKRINDLEDFAHEALNHLNGHLWEDRAVEPHIKEMLLKDARDFVERHCDDGEWTLKTISVNREYIN